MSIEAMKQALEALYRIENSFAYSHPVNGDELNAAIESLSQAIATEESSATQEPVAWFTTTPIEGNGNRFLYEQVSKQYNGTPDTVPLYTTPPQRTWVGLTDEQIKRLLKTMHGEPYPNDLYAFARAIEAKLKEKNGI